MADKLIKMKYLLSCLFLFLVISGKCQQTDFLYYLPDSVEIKLNEFIHQQNKKIKFFCILRTAGVDTFNVSVCKFDNREKPMTERWVFLTERKVVINKLAVPLIMDYDYMFSSKHPGKIGTYGDRADKIVRLLPIIHCFNVKFTKHYILDNANNRLGHANKLKEPD